MLDRLDGSAYPVLPVVDEQDRLLGVVDLEGIHFALQSPHAVPLLVVEDLIERRPAATPDDRLDHALELFVENDLMALPIVNDLRRRQVIGLVRRFDIAGAYLRHVQGSSLPAEPT